MALIAHYPLNGDLLDYSGNGYPLTNNGAVVDNNGKIGKCYNTNAAGYFDIPFTVADQIKGSFTVAIWFKVNSWNTSYAVIMSLTSGGVAWVNNMFLLSRNASSSNLVFAIGDKTTSTTAGCLSGTIDLNKWYHLTCVYEMGKRIKMYINGILVSSYNTTIVPTYSLRDSFRMGKSAGNSYQTDMLLNDARIYNHALSEKEIKELAKAKILHYTFDDNIPNDGGIIRDISGYRNDATLDLTTAPTWTADSLIGSGAYQFNSTNYIENNTIDFINKDFTISFWAKTDEYLLQRGLISKHNNDHFWTGKGLSISHISNPHRVYFAMTGETANLVQLPSSTLESYGWTHFVAIKEGNTYKFYTNSEISGSTVKDLGYVSNTEPLYIGKNSSGYGYKGLIDDVRIYATALTADDIKELYQTRMSLDSGGNLSVVAIVEQEDKVALSSKGILSLDNFSEVGITDGLVAWYPLDGNAEDRSGNQNHGTVYGATVAQGIDGLCYEFDRNLETYINCGNSNEININGAPTISISFWMNANSFSNVASIIFKNSHYSIAFYKNGETNGKITYADSSNWSFSSFGFMGDFNRNQWYFITMVKDVNSLVTFFVDGEILESKSFGGNLSLRTNDLHIGRYTGYLSFDGKIDDVRIYNRALSSDEIGILYDLGLSKTKLKMTDSTVYLKGQLKEV